MRYIVLCRYHNDGAERVFGNMLLPFCSVHVPDVTWVTVAWLIFFLGGGGVGGEGNLLVNKVFTLRSKFLL